jgi:peptide/nickel transport system ATP-binding protein
MTAPLLQVADLRVTFGQTAAVRGVSFDLGRERLGLVGESGSGKSSVARALMRLVPRGGRIAASKLEFGGQEILSLSEASMRRLRGRRIAMILQDPRFSLNPVMTIGRQIGESWRAHFRGTKAEASRRTLAMLESVGFREPERIARAYPHQLSGGEGQRAMIAMMLIGEPEMLIADEPTSALDVTVRNQVLAVLDDLVKRRGMGLLFISHDLDLVASFCDRILVMYGGRILESIEASEIAHARHPYTRGLLGAIPRIEDAGRELPVVPRDPAWLAEPGP